MTDASPFFATFAEAWAWFVGGGQLVALERQRNSFLLGRAQFLAFQVSIGVSPIVSSIETLQSELSNIDSLAPTPAEQLHISIHGVGFQVIARSRPDDVLRQDVGRIGERAAVALRGTPGFNAEVGPVNVFPDALILEVHPVEPFRDILRSLDAVGHKNAFPYEADQFLPHITIATFMDSNVATQLRDRLPSLRNRQQLQLPITRVELARWWFTGDDVAAPPELETVRSYRLA